MLLLTVRMLLGGQLHTIVENAGSSVCEGQTYACKMQCVTLYLSW